MSTWIRFEDAGPSASGKTQFWRVLTTQGGEELGHIQWFGRWRTYAFYPIEATVYEPTCLRDIADFIQARMAERRAAS